MADRCLSLAAVFLVLLAVTSQAAPQQRAAAGKVLFCYWGSWSSYRWGDGELQASMIDPNTCTHLVYAFAGLDPATYRIKVLDPWNDLPSGGGKDNYGKLVALKRQNADLKVLLAVGGWNEGGSKYSAMASRPDRRKNFIDSAAELVRQHGFDGIDLDWEWPGSNGGVAADKENYVKLVQELSAELGKSNLILTAASPADPTAINKGFNLPEVMKYLEYLAIMSYDYHTDYSRLDHPTPLKGKTSGQLSVENTVNYYLANGGIASKLLLGVSTYGRSFAVASSSQVAIGDRANGPGDAGQFTQQKGLLAWFELCYKIKEEKLTVKMDPDYQAPYAYGPYEWYAYENPDSLEKKVAFAKLKGLAGMMVWSLENDDNHQVCGDTLTSSLKKSLDK